MPNRDLQGKKYEDADIKVLMIGANRVGKSSLVARMLQKAGEEMDPVEGISTVEKALADTELTLNKQDNQFFKDSLRDMMDLYDDEKAEKVFGGVKTAQNAKTTGKVNCVAELTTKNRNGYTIGFCDIPGEWVKECQDDSFKEKDENKLLTKLVETADVLIVTIDAPLLMEGGGAYAESGNRILDTEYLIKNYYTPDSKGNNYKMVLFVPVKCEKYFNMHVRLLKDAKNYPGSNINMENDRMNLLIKKIEEKYGPTIDYLKGCTVVTNKKTGDTEKCVDIGILPVLTLGNKQFMMFKNVSSGEVNGDSMVLEDYFEDSMLSDPDRKKKNKYPTPRYCEIPLIYILLFTLAKAKKIKEDGRSIFDIIGRIFRNMASDRSLLKEVDPLRANLAKKEIVNGVPTPYVCKFIQKPMLDKLDN